MSRLIPSRLAAAIGAPRPNVSAVLSGARQTPWIRRAIAAELGRPYCEMWGEPDPGIDDLRRSRMDRQRRAPVNPERGGA